MSPGWKFLSKKDKARWRECFKNRTHAFGLDFYAYPNPEKEQGLFDGFSFGPKDEQIDYMEALKAPGRSDHANHKGERWRYWCTFQNGTMDILTHLQMLLISSQSNIFFLRGFKKKPHPKAGTLRAENPASESQY